MSDAVSDMDEQDSLSPREVIAYLRGNPEFLAQHPEACDYLFPPAQQGGRKVADFQSYMIRRLRLDKEEVLQTSKAIVETSRANMNNQQRMHKAVLRLLEAVSFDDFIRTVTMDLATILNVDIAALVVESNGREIPHVHTSGIRIIPPGTVDKWMEGKNILLQDDISGIEAIYGGGAALVRAQILLRVDIAMDTPPAILAFGSRDPDAFHEGQATDQILFLARVIERTFRLWLDRPG